MKLLTICLLFLSIVYAKPIKYKNFQTLQFLEIPVTHTYEGKSKEVILKRNIDPKCLMIGITPENVMGGQMAHETVPDECKKTFVTTLGLVQPIDLANIQTAGELEVLEHIVKGNNNPEKFILVDARKEPWFKQSTIPTAINIPYTNIAYDADFPEDYKKLLDTLNIQKQGNQYDFSKAKNAVIFCNGNWCEQSARAIHELLRLGYPTEKLMWYRGGFQEWLALGFTTIQGDLKEKIEEKK
jgi:rhodanese-related sulfurtransferase